MRLQFRTLTRPKQLAQRLQIVFPALAHMQSLEWAANILGYRDWHELAGSIRPDNQETPDCDTDSASPAEMDALYTRESEQMRVLASLVGRQLPEYDALFEHIAPNGSQSQYRRLGTPGKGAPCFQGLGYDLFSMEGEADCGGMGPVQEGSTAFISTGVPVLVEESEFVSQLLAGLARKNGAYPNLDQEALRASLAGEFAKSRLHLEPSFVDGRAGTVAVQRRRYRHFIVGKQGGPLGFAVIEFEARANSQGGPVDFEIKVLDAWWFRATRSTMDDLVALVNADAREPLCRLTWFGVPGAPLKHRMRVSTSSTTAQAQRLAQALVDAFTLLEADTALTLSVEFDPQAAGGALVVSPSTSHVDTMHGARAPNAKFG